ncbi:MAG: AAA family ATPase, partial [Gammaproteobacteria bacterium]|nr:AAA family ATPase [Gammaproteobacteria bacterium]
MNAPARERTVLGLPLAKGGATLIEASAGTGKTYALTTLVARLLVEQGTEIGALLVVTFTNAATDELRDRIRHTLRARGVV